MPAKRTSPIWTLLKIIISIASSIVVFFIITYIEGLSNNQIKEFLDIFNLPKYGAPIAGALITFASIFFALFILFPLINLIQNFFSALTGKYFVISLAALAILGGAAALYIPSYTGWFKTDTQQSTSSTQPTQNGQGSGNQQNQSSKDSSSDLRLHLLYITGGIIAVLGLIETNRKNSQDHIREVHAARRDRYIKAVDKLSSNDAPVRLGGVYALVGLVDEWLDDDNINRETQNKEGQIIINNLCSYIRSPFSLAAKAKTLEADSEPNNYKGDFSKDQAAFHEEQDVRRAIFVEMSKRSSTLTENKKGKVTATPGRWSSFDFDFSRAPIFYSLRKLKIEKGAFSYAKFYGNADFLKTVFVQDTEFFRTTFIQNAQFTGATFIQDANFIWSNFAGSAKFDGVNFAQNAHFRGVTFTNATFTGTVFTQNANFNNTTFTQNAHFHRAIFDQDANFHSATFNRKSRFSEATFAKNANFHDTTFNHDVRFSRTTFTGLADFSKATFNQKSYVAKATFAQKVNFDKALFIKSAPTFVSGDLRARFSACSSQEDYNFSVSSGSKPIHTRETKLDDVTRYIPIGTVLFDPSSPKDENGKYRESPPA